MSSTRRHVTSAAIVAAVLVPGLPAGAGAAAARAPARSGGTWGTAREVPGTAALNQGGSADVFSLSCASAGNCAAGGNYMDAFKTFQAFVASETSGTWGTAEEVPGTAALEGNRGAGTTSVSCAAAGDCAAGGQAGQHAFVAGEANGTWGTAEEVPGMAALNNDRPAAIASLSCASPGNCSAGGDYEYGRGKEAVFVATQTHGTWGTAEEVPGIAALNTRGNALIYALSCGAPGACATGGYYQQDTALHPFVASQVNGTWHTAQEVPGIAAFTHGLAVLTSVSCASAGNCSAGGNYGVNTSHQQAFVVTETTGPPAESSAGIQVSGPASGGRGLR